MIDEATFDKLATNTLDVVLCAFDDVDPDVVEAVPSGGVVRLDWQGARRDWVVNTQRGALQVWLAAEQQAWHFSYEGTQGQLKWVSPKTGQELFATLSGLLAEHAGLEVCFPS
jgi:iron donor protein CyaY